MKNSKVLPFIVLQVALFITSLGGICSKMAGKEKFLSFRFCLFYGLLIVVLGIYAILWQQVLKKISLAVAYACKGVTVLYGMLWGAIFFKEEIRLHMILGAAIVLLGIYFFIFAEIKEIKAQEAASLDQKTEEVVK